MEKSVFRGNLWSITTFLHFFCRKIWWFQKKAVILHRFREIGARLLRIERGIFAKWCNGSTTDSGSVCLGSSPGLATQKREWDIT